MPAALETHEARVGQVVEHPGQPLARRRLTAAPGQQHRRVDPLQLGGQGLAAKGGDILAHDLVGPKAALAVSGRGLARRSLAVERGEHDRGQLHEERVQLLLRGVALHRRAEGLDPLLQLRQLRRRQQRVVRLALAPGQVQILGAAGVDDQLVDVRRVSRGVKNRQGRAPGVADQGHPLAAQLAAQRLDVLDVLLQAQLRQRGRIRGRDRQPCGAAGAPLVVEHHAVGRTQRLQRAQAIMVAARAAVQHQQDRRVQGADVADEELGAVDRL